MFHQENYSTVPFSLVQMTCAIDQYYTYGHWRNMVFDDKKFYEFVDSKRNKDLGDKDKTAECVMGVAGEAAEVMDAYKKHLYHGHPLDDKLRNKILEECSDTLHYLTWIVHRLGSNLDEVAKINVEKINKRYPGGFTQEASINRKS